MNPLSMAPRHGKQERPDRPKPKVPETPTGPLLDKAEALEYLKISESYLYEILAAGELKRVQLPSMKTGGAVRRMLFRRHDLDNFINAHVV